jgi:hypothetical protein
MNLSCRLECKPLWTLEHCGPEDDKSSAPSRRVISEVHNACIIRVHLWNIGQFLPDYTAFSIIRVPWWWRQYTPSKRWINFYQATSHSIPEDGCLHSLLIVARTWNITDIVVQNSLREGMCVGYKLSRSPVLFCAGRMRLLGRSPIYGILSNVSFLPNHRFNIRDHSITQLWLHNLTTALSKYPYLTFECKNVINYENYEDIDQGP